MNKPTNGFSSTLEGFGTFFKDSSYSYPATLDGDNWSWNGSDIVTGPLNTSNATNPDVESRGFGTERQCFKSASQGIATNTEILPNPSLQNIDIGGLDFPRISKNIENKTDLFIISTDVDDVVITQIDP